MGFFTLRPPVRLGTRFAAMTLVALLAVQALNAAVFFLLPPPPSPVYSAHSVIEEVEETVAAVFAADKADRALLAELSGTRNNISIRWTSSREELPPFPPGADPSQGQDFGSSVLERVRVSLQKGLNEQARGVFVWRHGGPPPRRRLPLQNRKEGGLQVLVRLAALV